MTMAAKPDSQNKDELTLSDKINERIGDLIQKNRMQLLAALAAIVLVIVAFVVISVVREKTQSNALSKVDALNRRYEAIKESSYGEEDLDGSRQIELGIISSELTEFENKNSGFAAARAYSINANISMDQKNWETAEEKWLKAAEAAPKSYLAPIAVYNAAVAAEEQGRIEQAIAYYSRAADYGDSFPAAARAQFSVGRLEESRNNRVSAIEAYRNLLAKWPNEPVWPNLAQNRLLVLSD
jgi:tetratricopeptide (TPR) repeat protein